MRRIRWDAARRLTGGFAPKPQGGDTRSRRIRVLCVIDDLSRECLASVVDKSLPGHGHLLRASRAPKVPMASTTVRLPMCYGTELASNAIPRADDEEKRVTHGNARSPPVQTHTEQLDLHRPNQRGFLR